SFCYFYSSAWSCCKTHFRFTGVKYELKPAFFKQKIINLRFNTIAMNLHSYINNDVLPLLPNYPVKMVQGIFSDCTYTHIPVVEDHKLLGTISEDDVQGFDPEKRMSDYLYALDLFFVQKSTNWLDVLEAFAKFNANVMPVLDEHNVYIGYYELIDIMSLFKETPFLNEAGGVLIVEKGHKDYSFSEVSQIVESNNAKLLGAFISEDKDDITQITMKVGGSGLME